MSSIERRHRGSTVLIDDFVTLLRTDPEACDGEALAGLVGRSLRVRGWLDAFDARIATRAARLADEGCGDAPSTVLAGGGRRARRDVEAAVERGAVCSRMPDVAVALAAGALTAGHVDAIAGATRHLDDAGKQAVADHAETLVAAAATMSPEEFHRDLDSLARALAGDGGLSRHERLRHQRNVRRWVDGHSGMCKTLLSLDPLDDATVWTAFNASVAAARSVRQDDDERTWDQLQADAVVDHIVRQGTDDKHTGAPAAEVSVLIDYTALVDHGGRVAETGDGQTLPVEVIRRLGCDGTLVPVWLAGEGEVLAVGRQRRLASRAQRRALRAMYRSCGFPCCTAGFEQCRIHHVTYWERNGATDLANLIPLCERHHHLVHEGGWTLELHPGRRIILRRPDGTLAFDGVSTDRVSTPTATTFDHPSPQDQPSPASCRRMRPRPPSTVDDVVEALQLALDDILAADPGEPIGGATRRRGPP